MKILVGATPTPQGLAAVARSIEEAAWRPTELLVLNFQRVGPTSTDVTRRRSVRENLERLLEQAERESVSVRILEPIGVASFATEVLKLAREESVDQILIGIRERSRVGKLVLGSDEQEILLHADCPVLVVKAGNDSSRGR